MTKKITKKDKILVAGSRGMAGSAICRSLIRKGYGDTNKSGKLLVPTRNELDLLNFSDVIHWFDNNRPEIVIIAAAKVGGIYANSKYPTEFILENLKIQNNLIEASWKFGVKRLVFLGSSCIYPKYSNQPIKEEYLLQGGLETTNEPYAIAKIAGIKLCQYLRQQYGFDAISLMPTNLYGPNDNYHHENSHVVAALIKKFAAAKKNSYPSVTCWGTGEPLREFMHVDDLGDAVVFALENWFPSLNENSKNLNDDSIYYLNVGTGKDIKIKKLANIIATALNYKGEIVWDTSKPDGTPKKQLDISKIKNLGWKPKIELIEGITDTARSYFSKI